MLVDLNGNLHFCICQRMLPESGQHEAGQSEHLEQLEQPEQPEQSEQPVQSQPEAQKPHERHQLVFPAIAASIRQFSRQLRQNDTNLWYRLRSIVEDAKYVEEFQQNYTRFPVIANLRCGQWYVPKTINSAFPALPKPFQCYFKSTDGHCHHWTFSLNRLNISVLHTLSQDGGAIIIDSTRRGKRFPDSFTRTIPIWCCVMNRVLWTYKQRTINKSGTLENHTHPSISIEDSRIWQELHLPPSISSTERALIEKHLDEWASLCVSNGGVNRDLEILGKQIRKPIRPLWISRSTSHWVDEDRSFDAVPFTPLLLLNPCEVEDETGFDRRGWTYVQGAGDDEANWSRGMNPLIFWKHVCEFYSCRDVIECEQWVDGIVSKSKSQANTQSSSLLNNYKIENSLLSLTQCDSLPTYESSRDANVIIFCKVTSVKSSDNTVTNVNCSINNQENESVEERHNEQGWKMGNFYVVEIDATPKSKRSVVDHFPSILSFAAKHLAAKNSVLIASNDLSVALVVSASICLENYVLLEGKTLIPFPNHLHRVTEFMHNGTAHPCQISKSSIRQLLNYLKQYIPDTTVFPARVLLKQLNLYFLTAFS